MNPVSHRPPVRSWWSGSNRIWGPSPWGSRSRRTRTITEGRSCSRTSSAVRRWTENTAVAEVAVIGAGGYLGSAICEELRAFRQVARIVRRSRADDDLVYDFWRDDLSDVLAQTGADT